MAGVIPNGKIVTDIDINTIKATTSLKDLKQAVQNTTSAWRAQQTELRSAGKASEAAAAKYKGLGEAIDKQKAYINRLKEANVAYQNTLKTSNRSTQEGRKEYNNAATALEKNVRQLNSARTRLASLTGQQEKARTSMNYYKSGLNKLQSEYRTSGNLSKSYVNRLEAEGQHQKANAERAKAYSNAIRNLSSQQKIQVSELSRIAQTAGKSSEAYKRQQIRVNETATSLAKAKTQMSNVNSEMRKANPSIFDRIKSKLTGINKTGEQTHRTFKEVFMGSALGNAAVNALSNIGSQLKSVYKDGMQANAVAGKIDSRFKAMGESKNAIRGLDNQIKSLKYNTGMTGEQVADLQSHMLNWSSIGRKGAMQMAKAVAGIGDSSKLTGEQTERLGQGLMRVGSAGKATFSSLNRITKGAPTFYAQLAKGAGMSESHLKSLLRSGNVTQKQFQKWMAASAKYSDTAFKGYSKTQGGAIHRMQQSWIDLKRTMMKPLFNAKSSGLQGMSKLLTSKELKNGAKAIGNGINSIVNAAYKHRKDITGIAKDVVSIAVELGKSLWKDFAAIIGDIGKAFGLVHGNSKKSGGSLHTVKLAMDGLAKNRTAIQWISKAIIAMAAVKGLAKVSNGIVGITSASYGAYRKVSALRAGLKGIEDVKKFKGAEGAFNSLGLSISKVMPKLKGLLGFKGASAGKFTGMLQSLRSARKAGGLTTAGKIATGAAVAGIAVDSGADIYKAIKAKAGSKKQYEDIGSGAGKAIGGGIGLYFGGPLGAAIGAKIGGTIGKWAGNAAKKFQNGWNAHKPPKKFWSLENLGWSTHNMINKVGKLGRNTAKSFGKGLNNAKKGISSFSKNISKGINGGMNKTAKAFQKGWNTIYKHSSKGTRQIMRGVKTFGKSYVKNHEQYQRATAKNFASFGKRLKKNHGNLFKTIGQTTKTQLKITGHYWSKNWKATAKFAKSVWGGLTQNARSMYNNLNKATHGGLGKAMRGFHNFGSTLGRFWKNLWNGIFSFFRNIFGRIANGVGKLGNIIGKFTSGKLKVGSLHLANGTDWHSKYPVPAVVNDGYDSPETNNREGLIDTDGSLRLFPNIRNFRFWLLPGQEVVRASDMAQLMTVRHFASGTKKLGTSRLNAVKGTSIAKLNSELKLLAKQLKIVEKLARRSLDFKFLKKNQKQLAKFTSTFKQLVKADKKLNTETKHSVTNFKNLTRRLNSAIKVTEKLYKETKRSKFGNYIDKQARKAVKSLRGKGNFAQQFKKLVSQFRKDLKSFETHFKKEWESTWDKSNKDFGDWAKKELGNQRKFKDSFEKGFKTIGTGIERVSSKTWRNMQRLAGKGMNAVIRVLNSGISRINSVVHQFGGSSSIHHVAGVHYANGTTALQKPTLAIVNDGNDSPETGNKESFYNHNTGEFGIFQGRNAHVMVPAGVDIYKAGDTRDFMYSLGYKHFANGTGGTLKQLYELTKKYFKNSVSTLNSMFGNADSGFKNVMRSITYNAQKVGQDTAQTWWTTLWRMVHQKIEDSDGPASGLLKAVEKYGHGHSYVWGAAGPTTFDCSGLVMYALKKAYGISYPHFSGAQYARTQHISKSQARMGDLVFWGPGGSDHVGVYAGGNHYYSAESPSMGIHMNTLSSVVGKGAPKFGRVRDVNTQGHKHDTVKANSALEKFVRASVGKGFWATIRKIADKYGVAGNPAGDGVARWRNIIKAALSANHLAPTSWRVHDMMRLIARESGGNPRAVNNWDINAQHGNPSKGIAQITVSNFRTYHHRGHNNILNGYDNLLAAISYIIAKYGSGVAAFNRVASGAYANGGIATRASIFGEAGPEMAIPLLPTKATRAWELIGKAVAILGSQSGIGVDQSKQQQQEKKDKAFRQKLLDLLTIIASGQGQTIQTDISIDGRKAWQAMSRYAKQDQRREMNYGRKGFSSGFTI